MRTPIITLCLIVFLAETFAQVRGFEFTRTGLKGHKSIVATTTIFNENDSAVSKSIYHLDPEGDIVKSEHYEGEELISTSEYDHDADGLLRYEKTHNQVFHYDEDTQKEVAEIRDDVFFEKSYEYNGPSLVRIAWKNAYKGNESANDLVVFEYDLSGRLTREISITGDAAFIAELETKDYTIDSLTDKQKVSLSITIHHYSNDSIVTIRMDENNEVLGYSRARLDSKKKPLEILDTDPVGNHVRAVSRHYDHKGNLTHEVTDIIDVEKIDKDLVAGDDYRLFYNKNSLPVLAITRENGKIISRQVVHYQ